LLLGHTLLPLMICTMVMTNFVRLSHTIKIITAAVSIPFTISSAGHSVLGIQCCPIRANNNPMASAR
jgi:hypothetical protein